MACDQYIRLRQHYEAALTHWEHVILSSQGAFENSPPAVVEMKKKALEESAMLPRSEWFFTSGLVRSASPR
jgi:hypothetical protein